MKNTALVVAMLIPVVFSAQSGYTFSFNTGNDYSAGGTFEARFQDALDNARAEIGSSDRFSAPSSWEPATVFSRPETSGDSDGGGIEKALPEARDRSEITRTLQSFSDRFETSKPLPGFSERFEISKPMASFSDRFEISKPLPGFTRGFEITKPSSAAGSDLIEGTPGVPLTAKECAIFKEQIFKTYLFTDQAADYIRQIPLVVSNNPREGGGCFISTTDDDGPADKRLDLANTHQAVALHEFGHAWYEKLETDNPGIGSELVEAIVRLADMDPAENPQYAAAIAEANSCKDNVATEMYACFTTFIGIGQSQGNQMQVPEFIADFYTTLFITSADGTSYNEYGKL